MLFYFRVAFHDSKRNTKSGFLGSKAVGEQAFLMGCSAIFALRRAIDSVRMDKGENPMPFYKLGLYLYLRFLHKRLAQNINHTLQVKLFFGKL